jgi:hypothetical protein
VRSRASRRSHARDDADRRPLWIIAPQARTVARRTPLGPLPTVNEDGTLDAGDVVPDFAMPVADLFDGLAREP